MIRCPECGHTLGRWVEGQVVSTYQGRTWFGMPDGIACEAKGCRGVWRLEKPVTEDHCDQLCGDACQHFGDLLAASAQSLHRWKSKA